ncbi:MAG TPA: AMP-binding protein, partial [Acidimicrobiales bacterium]
HDPAWTTADGEVTTYGQLTTEAGRIAAVLAEHGVQRGDRVAALVEKSPTSLLLYLACVTTGVVYVPMNPGYTDAEVDHVLSDADPQLLVHDPARAWPERAPRTLTLDPGGAGSLYDAARSTAPAPPPGRPVEPDDAAAILYTSGTTGRPKGAVLTQANLASNASALVDLWGFTRDDVLLHVLPTYHAHGLFVAVHCALASASQLVLLDRFTVDGVLDHLPRATVLMGVPTHYTRLLGDPRFDRDLTARMRLFVSGSAPMPAALHEAFRARTGHAVLERYGMTETVMISSNPLNGERRAGTVGQPLPGVEVRITDRTDGTDRTDPADPTDQVDQVDQEGAAPPAAGVVGVVGMIEVRGPNVSPGYWRDPERTAADRTPDGWFRTGDLGRFDDGYLTIVGREKDLVISGGLNVYPKEVEDALERVDGVAESAVIGVPDADLGECVVAIVVPVPGARLDPARLRAATRDRLAAYKVPKRVEVVPDLPRNAMGKIEKAVLRHRFAGPPEPGSPSGGPPETE